MEDITGKIKEFLNEHGLTANIEAMQEGDKRDITNPPGKSFTCYGNSEDSIYFTLIDPTVFIVCGFIPLMVFVLVLAFCLKCVSPAEQFWYKHMICLPCYCVTERKYACSYSLRGKSCCDCAVEHYMG